MTADQVVGVFAKPALLGIVTARQVIRTPTASSLARGGLPRLAGTAAPRRRQRWSDFRIDKQQLFLFDNNYPMIISGFTSLCREHGLAATHQRRVIYETVMSLEGHPSPELIYDVVKKKIPSISLATVYKNVHTFLASGMLREVSMHHGSIRVEPNKCEHYHLVCTRCRSIQDLDPEGVQVQALTKKRSLKGFHVTRIAVDVLGICAACAGKERSTKSRRRDKTC